MLVYIVGCSHERQRAFLVLAKFVHNAQCIILAPAKSQKKCAAKVNQVCKGETHLLLSHNPKAFPAASDCHIPLTLSGHTHGGQLALRDKPSTNLAVAHKHSSGLYNADNSRLFVSVGVGAWFPLRINCPAEVAVLTVRSA